MTSWWLSSSIQSRLLKYSPSGLSKPISAIVEWARAGDPVVRRELADRFDDLSALDRYMTLAGLILWAGELRDGPPGGIGPALSAIEKPEAIVAILVTLLKDLRADTFPEKSQVWQVSLNRKAMLAVERSVPAVKADAARTLFKVNCHEIRWAVLDSGIDASHPALLDQMGNTRVVAAFDFSKIRQIARLDGPVSQERIAQLLHGREAKVTNEQAKALLKTLAEDADTDRPMNWELVRPFIEIDPTAAQPLGGHGTHVAGIIGASREAAKERDPACTAFDGMCPDIKLYDFRVLAKSLEETEFAIIAALQFVRYLNERNGYISIHGANLSLSIPHDVRNFACGRTPICHECERLVASGVVVVAAAGNLGYRTYEGRDGSFEGYAAFSITDPGNAEDVITVGATHRFWPHTYGVSFFSSRGPTGDGRPKPDLVAPGERIFSCLPANEWGALDGTSMAAPHVSGAAAMLMARYSELIGRPREIKRLLCEAATDLGRERSFQGHGMLDVLRAFQKL
jgi:hypothetical protein